MNLFNTYFKFCLFFHVFGLLLVFPAESAKGKKRGRVEVMQIHPESLSVESVRTSEQVQRSTLRGITAESTSRGITAKSTFGGMTTEEQSTSKTAEGGWRTVKKPEKRKPGTTHRTKSEQLPIDSQSCRVDIGSLPETQPLFLKRVEGTFQFLFPERKHFSEAKPPMKFNFGQRIFVACPGSKIDLGLEETGEVEEPVCKGNNKWEMRNMEMLIEDIKCKQEVKAEVRDTQNSCRVEGATLLEVGFQVDNSWLPLIEVCFHKGELRTYYTVHTIHGRSCRRERLAHIRFSSGNKSLFPSSFVDADMYNVMSVENAMKIQGFDVVKFSHGHLPALTDFPTLPLQKATFFTELTAPQTFFTNSGIMVSLEESNRSVARFHGADLIVYSGTYGQMRSQKRNNEPLYLMDPKHRENKTPIPEYFYRLIKLESACMFFIVRNYYERNELQFCENLCKDDDNKWITQFWVTYVNSPHNNVEFEKREIKNMINCCNYEEVKQKIPYLQTEDCATVLEFPQRLFEVVAKQPQNKEAKINV